MNVIDSSGWLEYFANANNAGFFSKAIQDTSRLVVPTLSLFEVFKRILQLRDENDALLAVATMQQGHVVDLTPSLALAAAKLSTTTKLPMADSIMLATARAYQATLWTQDADFKGHADVQYMVKRQK